MIALPLTLVYGYTSVLGILEGRIEMPNVGLICGLALAWYMVISGINPLGSLWRSK